MEATTRAYEQGAGPVLLDSANGLGCHGLQLREGMRYDAWVDIGRRVARISIASCWWLGDWLLFGQRTFPQRYRAACDATSLDYQTLRNYAWVASRVHVSRRRDTLSFQHHAEVAALDDPQQHLWLRRAEAGDWSRNELRRRLAAERNARTAPAEQVCVRIEIAVEREHRWRTAAAAAGLDLVAWMASTVDAAADAMLSEEGHPAPAPSR